MVKRIVLTIVTCLFVCSAYAAGLKAIKIDTEKVSSVKSIYPEFEFQNAKDLNLTDDGKLIVHIVDDPKLYNKLMLFAVKDELPDTKTVLPQFIGCDEKDVFDVYPEMADMIEIGKDENSKSIMRRRLTKHLWKGCKACYWAIDPEKHDGKFKVKMKSTKSLNVEAVKSKQSSKAAKLWFNKAAKLWFNKQVKKKETEKLQ